MAGRVDDVDPNAIPGTGRGGGGNGDATLLLLLHPVHGGGTLMNLTDAVVHTRIKENAFRRRRLAGIDVSHDADVAAFAERNVACHGVLLFCEPGFAVALNS